MYSVLEDGSVVQTLLNLATDKKPKKDAKIKGADYLGGSISKYSKKLIMSFPLLCDAGLPLDTVMMVSKANERNIVNMLQLLFSSLNLQVDGGVGGADIISKIYKDLDPNMTYNDFIDALDKISGGQYSTMAGLAKNESKVVIDAKCKQVIAEWRTQKDLPFKKESINEKSINDFSVKTIYGKTIVTEDVNDAKFDYQRQRDAAKDAYQQQKDAEEKRREEKEDLKNKQKYQDDLNRMKKDIITQRFLPQDVKKANDAEPTLLLINYVSLVTKNGNGDIVEGIADRKTFVTGVKSRAIPVESIDIAERFVTKDKTALNLKNLIRATTGEISLFKDFILCFDKLKLDAKNSAKRGPLANYWNILEKRSIKNNVNKLKRQGNDGSAITTICVSQDTVNFMKNAYRFDLENIGNAKMIMDSYNLLGLIIADEATESIKILYDGYNEFEVLSYTALQRDFSERDYKKTINMINHSGR